MHFEPCYVHPMDRDTDSFRTKLHAARPELAVFRSRPWWQRRLLHLVWLVFPNWLPPRERAAAVRK